MTCQHEYGCRRCGTWLGRKAAITNSALPGSGLVVPPSRCETWLARKAEVIPAPDLGNVPWPGPPNTLLPRGACSYDIFWNDTHPDYREDWTDRVWFSWKKPCNE